MAGMFYSLQEAAGKLNVTEDELKELISDGRLREFRIGPNVFFKTDEVEALMSDTSVMASKGTVPEPPEPEQPEQPVDTDEISLAPDTTEDAAAESGLTGLTDADTALSSQGIDVLGDTEGGESQLIGDTMAETKGTTGEASLEEIEGDVNLDTFGSGSGLLDLSLQADDTSLGGILDEIYTPEGGEGKEADEAGSAMAVAAEVEQILPEEELVVPEPAPGVSAMAPAYVEPEPDTLSNALGVMLFLPLFAVVYTAIVAVAGLIGVMPSILATIQGIIWYIVIGAAVASCLILLAGFMLSGEVSKGPKKPAKPKKRKRAKKAPPPAPEQTTV